MSLFGTKKCELCGRAAEGVDTFVAAQHQGGTVWVCKDKSTCLPWNPNEAGNVAQDPASVPAGSRPAYIKKKNPKAADLLEQDQAVQLAKELFEAKTRKSELEDELKGTNKAIADLEDKLSELMETRHIDLFRVKGYGTFYTTIKNYPSVVDPDGFISWLDQNQMGAMAKRTVHPATLQAWVKSWLADGKPLPKAKSSTGQEYDLLNNYQRVRVGTRKE